MLREVGYCSGVENYARWFSGRNVGEPPYTLIDFFPEDFLCIVDESHVSLPQVAACTPGTRAESKHLSNTVFVCPALWIIARFALKNGNPISSRCCVYRPRPAQRNWNEPAARLSNKSSGPPGWSIPSSTFARHAARCPIWSKKSTCAARKERVLVTTLTKRMSEDLTNYFREAGLRCKWLHSELDAIERVQVLRELREGGFDVLVGVNLLREGLDLPEVSLVAVLDADKEGFLRSETSLIQTIGRAARNVNAEVILYADRVTDSMQRAMDETARRRELQLEYNKTHGITPRTVVSAIKSIIEDEIAAHQIAQDAAGIKEMDYVTAEYLEQLQEEMLQAAKDLDFERAAQLRDTIRNLKRVACWSGKLRKQKRRRTMREFPS